MSLHISGNLVILKFLNNTRTHSAHGPAIAHPMLLAKSLPHRARVSSSQVREWSLCQIRRSKEVHIQWKIPRGGMWRDKIPITKAASFRVSQQAEVTN